MMNTKLTFEQYRAWLLNPLPGEPNPLDEVQASNPNFLTGTILEAMLEHDWAAEPELNHIQAYSPHRAARIINHRWTLPISAHRINTNQIFQAEDHGLPTLPNDKSRAMLDKLLRDEDELVDVYGEYLLRHPVMLQNIQVNRTYYNTATHNSSRDEDIKHLDNIINAARVAHQHLFQRQLKALLNPLEYAEVYNLQPAILEGLYPEIWVHGLDMHQTDLLQKQPIEFEHFTWQSVEDGEGMAEWRWRH